MQYIAIKSSSRAIRLGSYLHASRIHVNQYIHNYAKSWTEIEAKVALLPYHSSIEEAPTTDLKDIGPCLYLNTSFAACSSSKSVNILYV